MTIVFAAFALRKRKHTLFFKEKRKERKTNYTSLRQIIPKIEPNVYER